MRRSRMALALGLGLLVLGGLGGCSDDPVPKIAPSESPSASESPAADVQRTPVATVRAWVNARNRALQSGDTSTVEELSATSCETCDGLIDPIKRIYAHGGHFETTGWQLVRVKQRRSAQPTTVDTGVTIAGGVTVPKAGGKPNRYPSEDHVVVFKLSRQSGQLVIAFVGFLS